LSPVRENDMRAKRTALGAIAAAGVLAVSNCAVPLKQIEGCGGRLGISIADGTVTTVDLTQTGFSPYFTVPRWVINGVGQGGTHRTTVNRPMPAGGTLATIIWPTANSTVMGDCAHTEFITP
jgi:hypothetical protein